MEEIPMTEIWFVDIKKYIYDTLDTYFPLKQKWLKKVIIRNFESVAKEQRPFIAFSSIWGRTNNFWIRNESFQIDVFSESIEQWENIKDIVIDLLNRRNFKGIKSQLTRTWPDGSDEKTWFCRLVMDFEFVFKDMKY